MNAVKLLRRWVCATIAAALLFAQLAEAAYVCPGVREAFRASAPAGGDGGSMRPTGSGAEPARADVPCALMFSGLMAVDPDQPGLCFRHCQADTGQPPLDSADTVVEPQPLPPLLFQLAAPQQPAALAPAWREREHRREHAPPEAHRLAHCCYRI